MTAAELQQYRSLVSARIKSNEDNPAWGILLRRWEALLAAVSHELEVYQSGVPTNRHEVAAWRVIGAVGMATEPMVVIEVVLAMYTLQEFNPRRFKSDQAFITQLVRRVRSLAPMSVATYIDHLTKKPKRVYRDCPAGVTRVIGALLVETFGHAGLVIAKLEQREATKIAEESKLLHSALGDLR